MAKNFKQIKFIFSAISIPSTIIVYLLGCAESTSEPFNERVFENTNRRLYVATGSCYGGGVAVSPGPANLIAKLDIDTGAVISTVIDYNQLNPGDSPIAIQEYDQDRILVLVENASGRRVDLVNKDGSNVSLYVANATALSAVGRAMAFLSDFSLLISKSSAIEKFNSAKARVTSGANPYVNAPAGACATSTTLISSMAVFPNGKILYAHAAATPNNKIAMISASGYSVAGDCLVAQAAPATTALPTRILLHSSGQTLVSYGSLTSASNFIYSYTVDSTANTITAPIASWTDFSVVNGPSAMAEDMATGDVFVANATSTFNTIERFNYDATTSLLTKANNQTYKLSSIYSRCVTDMKVMP